MTWNVSDRIKNEMKKDGNGGGKYFIKDLKCMQDDVSYQYLSGITPLHVAVANDDKNKACSLLGKGVDVLKVTAEALHFAANIDTVKCLLRHGAVFDAKNALGQTPLDLARDEKVPILLKRICYLFDRAAKGEASLLDFIKGLDPGEVLATTNARNSQGNTLLQVILLHKHKDLAKELGELLRKTTRENVS
ncbi:ankyrin-3 [Trichonephila clavipes]|nr:ankyrin-3 [Trichonephila clavipes]